jgi:glucokinase
MVDEFIAGIDIGGTKIAVAIAAPGGEIVARHSFPTNPARGPHEALNQTCDVLERLTSSKSLRLTAIGIGCAGPLDLERGVVTSPPNLPLWREFPLRALVEDRFGIPVILDNDANAAALGEHLYGAGRGFKDLVYLTISTGIGGGIIADNKLVHRLGEAGHITVQPDGALCNCGTRGCLEALCSGTAIARRAQEELLEGRQSKLKDMVQESKQVTAKTVEDAAQAGDDVASEVWQETIGYLAIGIGSIIALLAPQAVILGGGVVAGAGEFLLAPLRKQLDERVRIVRVRGVHILQAGLGADSGVYGALALGASVLQVEHASD